MKLERICVYCASSPRIDELFFQTARHLGRELARNSITVIYGGGAVGLMGALADAALAEGGEIIGIIPDFMQKLEWSHSGVEDMRVVNDMHARKAMMMQEADAFIALPGGTGTLEELLEVMTWKRLGLHSSPIVILNTRGFYDPLVEQLERCLQERFLEDEPRDLWLVVNEVDRVLPALRGLPLRDAGSDRDAPS